MKFSSSLCKQRGQTAWLLLQHRDGTSCLAKFPCLRCDCVGSVCIDFVSRSRISNSFQICLLFLHLYIFIPLELVAGLFRITVCSVALGSFARCGTGSVASSTSFSFWNRHVRFFVETLKAVRIRFRVEENWTGRGCFSQLFELG